MKLTKRERANLISHSEGDEAFALKILCDLRDTFCSERKLVLCAATMHVIDLLAGARRDRKRAEGKEDSPCPK